LRFSLRRFTEIGAHGRAGVGIVGMGGRPYITSYLQSFVAELGFPVTGHGAGTHKTTFIWRPGFCSTAPGRVERPGTVARPSGWLDQVALAHGVCPAPAVAAPGGRR
jgi:hypothetical protein